jgi:hypothetical protein
MVPLMPSDDCIHGKARGKEIMWSMRFLRPAGFFFPKENGLNWDSSAIPGRLDGRLRVALRFARSMRGPCYSSDKRRRVRGASDSEGSGRGVVWMSCRRREDTWDNATEGGEERCNTRSTFEHPNTIVTTYVWRQLKHLYMLLKYLKKHLKTLEKHCNHTQHPNKTNIMYVWNICNIQINTLATCIRKT